MSHRCVREEVLAPEEVLHGGTANRGLVVRIGDTVRRPLRRTSPATHALLRHLADVGFDGAPRFLGVDERGREVLTFLPGTPVVPPYPEWALTDEALVSVDNVVFRDGRAVALIDFDLAAPGSRLWDVACAARLWVPLRPDDTVDDARRGRTLTRLRSFVDGYGVPVRDRPRLVDAVGANHEWFRELIRTHAEEGHAVFAEHRNPAERERARRFRAWFAENGRALRAALDDPPSSLRNHPTPEGR